MDKSKKLEKQALNQVAKMLQGILSKIRCDTICVTKEDFKCSTKIIIKVYKLQ